MDNYDTMMNSFLMLSAINTNAVTAVKELLDQGFNVNYNDFEAIKAACNLSSINSEEILDSLTDKIYSINVNGVVIFEWACQTNHKPLVKSLIKSGFKVKNSKECLNLLIKNNNDVEMLNLLLEKGADIHANNDNAIIRCAMYNRVKMMKILVEKGCDINTNNGYAIIEAAQNNYVKLLDYIIKNKGDIEANNYAALRYAAENGHHESVKMLLDAGSDVHANYGSPIKAAAKNGDIPMLELLLSYGAKKSDAESYGGEVIKKYFSMQQLSEKLDDELGKDADKQHNSSKNIKHKL